MKKSFAIVIKVRSSNEMGLTLGYIDPIAFSIGPIHVRWYGIIIACGILLGYFIAQAALKMLAYIKIH